MRVKGLLNICGRDKPIVVQAIQKLFHPPAELAEWPSDDRRSRIVFITRNLDETYVRQIRVASRVIIYLFVAGHYCEQGM